MFERSGGIGSEGIYDSPTDDRNNRLEVTFLISNKNAADNAAFFLLSRFGKVNLSE